MKEKIFILLDELVSMSNSSFTTDSLNLELNEIESNINKCNSDIARFESDIDDAKYFDISSQMMDRNIEVNLSKKLKKTEASIDDIEMHLEEALKKEQECHTALSQIENEIEDCKKLSDTLDKKIKSVKNAQSEKTYKDLLENTKEKIAKKEEEKAQLLTSKEEAEQELQLLAKSKEELTEKLADDNQKLADTQKMLANEKNYYNYDAKKNDEEYLAELHNRLEKLEKRKLELLTDPANLASEAKEMIAEGNTSDAIAKIKELVAVIELIPDIKETDVESLKAKETKLKTDIEDKKKTLLDNQYKTVENDVLESRVGYLNNLIEELTGKVNSFKESISEIDNKLVVNLKLEIDHAEESKKRIEAIIKELEDLNKEKYSNGVYASIITYQKELDSINKTISKQNEDLEYLINLSGDLDSNVANIEDRIAEKSEEISALEKEISFKSILIDEKAKAKDEDELSNMEEQLDNIEHRLKYRKTPQDLLNDIDCLLGSLDFDEPQKREYVSRLEKNKDLFVDEVEDQPEEEVVTPEVSTNKVRLIEVEEPEKKDEPTNIFGFPEPVDDQEEMNFDDIINLIGDN